MSAPTITQASGDDVAACAALVARQAAFAVYAMDAARLRRSLDEALERGETVLCVHLDGVAVGVAWLVPRGAFARSAYVRLIAVAPEALGRGIGSLLMERVECAASAHGDDLFLLVTSTNVAAQRFYARRGFTPVGRLHDYVVPGVDELLMRKRLAPAAG